MTYDGACVFWQLIKSALTEACLIEACCGTASQTGSKERN